MVEEYTKYKLYRKYYTTDGVNYNPTSEYQAVKIENTEDDCDCGYRYISFDKLSNSVVVNNKFPYMNVTGFTVSYSFKITNVVEEQQRYYYDLEIWSGNKHLYLGHCYGGWIKDASTTVWGYSIPLFSYKVYEGTTVYYNLSTSSVQNASFTIPYVNKVDNVITKGSGRITSNTSRYYGADWLDSGISASMKVDAGYRYVDVIYSATLTVYGYPKQNKGYGYSNGQNNYYCKGTKYETGETATEYIGEVNPVINNAALFCGSSLGSEYEQNAIYEKWQSVNNNELFYLKSDIYTCDSIPTTITIDSRNFNNWTFNGLDLYGNETNDPIGNLVSEYINCQYYSKITVENNTVANEGLKCNVYIYLYGQNHNFLRRYSYDETIDCTNAYFYRIFISKEDNTTIGSIEASTYYVVRAFNILSTINLNSYYIKVTLSN